MFVYDVLIVGSGAAGLCAALNLDRKLKIGVLSKNHAQAGSTARAQGGIAAVLTPSDSFTSHIQDTLVAGAGLCKKKVVKEIIHQSREAIHWLIAHNMPFTRSTQEEGACPYDLTREGGHSRRRILHAEDATGLALSDTLLHATAQRENITLLEQKVALDLITQQDPKSARQRCTGVYVLDRHSSNVEVYSSSWTILATGGVSNAYLYSSNVDTSSGDGIAMAWRAGCRIANLEFNQFHPTCLYHPHAQSILISEAVRGEGGRLVLPNGERFMPRFHPQAELAPRDIVARTIDFQMKCHGIDSVFLDISHKPKNFILRKFPMIYQTCGKYNIDMSKEPIPVVPSAHYTCGGVVTQVDGKTDIEALFAIGETSHTGLHGANRLASNSLLECLVCAAACARTINARPAPSPLMKSLPPWDASQVTDSDENIVITHNWQELRRFMWDYVGIVRTNKRLQRAQNRVLLLKKEIQEFYSHYKISRDLIELRNLTLVSELIIACAMRRKESRGLHCTLDYPKTSKNARDTVLTPPNYLQARKESSVTDKKMHKPC